MKVFITGTESFVGKELISLCRKNGFEVSGIDAVAPSDRHFAQCDLNSSEIDQHIPENVDAFIHLAALSRDPDCKNNGKNCFSTNVMGTLNSIDAAVRRKAKQFIFASTEWVYDSCTADQVKTEDSLIDVAKHTSEYALSKLVSENNLRQKYSHGFCDTTILRFGIIYGPRPNNWSAVESLFHQVREKDEIQVGSLATGRCFIHVKDICDGIFSAIGLKGFNTVNLQGNQVVTLGQVIELSQKIHDRRIKVTETNSASASVRNISGMKAKDVLKWSPKISIEDGLKSLL